ncbi:hypothetical protein [Chitinophaga sancti]|uniref:Cytochrome C and Quinol oxidase polypeptide I n=1 Tax=Chitinophaga sancti TaxID=1004 RepID=A0A1K1M1Q6_9BACT|nr:hypothetical protein [Chitinophaga sancti]WQD64699.1 hypothetical protein U0033_09855 [Chitinophaga sancti]WQG89679.1 hypothetical protein SR876_32620 [Chitinophaga sancti]SFW17066.1 hypothetical protein SAMN05661012_00376 [Chitinophaga sancti]
MYQTFLFLHAANRYLVLISLVYAIVMAGNGIRSGRVFSPLNNTVRHLTATIGHIQLMLGLYLYIISPIVKYSVVDSSSHKIISEAAFFRYLHVFLMTAAIVIMTIGSAKAKRMETDKQKFMTILVWFSIALLVILIAIPWPFSPLAKRPYFRSF